MPEPSIGPTPEDLVAAAIGTAPRAPVMAVAALDFEERQALARSAHRRAEVISAGARLGLLHESVLDRRCHDRVMPLITFVRHCADVQHNPGDVEVLGEQHPERDLGRQGESRTALDSQW